VKKKRKEKFRAIPLSSKGTLVRKIRKENKISAGSDETASMDKGGGYVGACTSNGTENVITG
jgi:hypothetical protein